MAIKRAAEDAREEMAELLVWQQKQNEIDAELRRQAAAERQRTSKKLVEKAAKPGTVLQGAGDHDSAPVRRGAKVLYVTAPPCNVSWSSLPALQHVIRH